VYYYLNMRKLRTLLRIVRVLEKVVEWLIREEKRENFKLE